MRGGRRTRQRSSSIRFHYFVSSSKEYGAGIADSIHFNCKWNTWPHRLRHASCFWHFFPKFEHRNRFFSLFFFFDESLDIVFSWSSEFIHRSLIERSAIDTNLYYLKKFQLPRGNDLERVSRFENQLPPRRFPTEPVKFSSKTRSHWKPYSGTIAIFQGENLGIVLVNVVSPGGAAKETKRECTRFRPVAFHLLRNTILVYLFP